MKTQEFLNVLKENSQKELVFEYKEGELVGANYHITEVKNMNIKAVDCGGKNDAWNETIIQLWESPKEIGKRDYMLAGKALEILERVDNIYAIDKDAVVLFEYSNENFHKANLEIHNVEFTANKILIKLFVSETDCKAKSSCETPKKELAVAEDSSCCSDSTGCC